jgi:hypothetical protein
MGQGTIKGVSDIVPSSEWKLGRIGKGAICGMGMGIGMDMEISMAAWKGKGTMEYRDPSKVSYGTEIRRHGKRSYVRRKGMGMDMSMVRDAGIPGNGRGRRSMGIQCWFHTERTSGRMEKKTRVWEWAWARI